MLRSKATHSLHRICRLEQIRFATHHLDVIYRWEDTITWWRKHQGSDGGCRKIKHEPSEPTPKQPGSILIASFPQRSVHRVRENPVLVPFLFFFDIANKSTKLHLYCLVLCAHRTHSLELRLRYVHNGDKRSKEKTPVRCFFTCLACHAMQCSTVSNPNYSGTRKSTSQPSSIGLHKL